MPPDRQPDDDASPSLRPDSHDRQPPPGRKDELPPGPPHHDHSALQWLQRRRSWVLPLGLVIAMAATFAMGRPKADTTIDYTTFYQALEGGEVSSVLMRGAELEGELSTPRAVDGKKVTHFQTRLPAGDDPALLPLMRSKGVAVRVEADGDPGWFQLLSAILPFLLIFGVWFYVSKRMRAPGGAQGGIAAMLGKHDKRYEREDAVDVRFDDVAGLDGAKRDLGEIVAFLRHPESFTRLGGKMPRGALLIGAPGTGKTLLARAVAGEAGVPFFSISGSEFIELFVGVGASRVRELFAAAKKAPHAIIFIDEIDAVGRSRGTGLGGGHDEREQTLNQLLAAMDGFDRTDQVVVLAATNRPDVLDSALLRPGRFDRSISVDLPACGAREAILQVHARDKPLAPDVVFAEIAAATPGFSGAELANLVNEATLRAVRRGGDWVTAADFDLAQDKILLGDRRDGHLTADEKRRVAVHEAGHSLLAHLLEPSAPLRRVSILPRGNALGATQQSPRGDAHLHTRSELLARLAVLLGGYAAEKLVFGEVSSGAENDLRQASGIAQRMVSHLGMSETLGPVFHEHRSEHPFLGARIATDSGVSDATIHAIERETQLLLSGAEAHGSTTLRLRRGLLDRLQEALLEQETLDQEELLAVLAEEPSSPRTVPAADHSRRLPWGSHPEPGAGD